MSFNCCCILLLEPDEVSRIWIEQVFRSLGYHCTPISPEMGSSGTSTPTPIPDYAVQAVAVSSDVRVTGPNRQRTRHLHDSPLPLCISQPAMESPDLVIVGIELFGTITEPYWAHAPGEGILRHQVVLVPSRHRGLVHRALHGGARSVICRPVEPDILRMTLVSIYPPSGPGGRPEDLRFSFRQRIHGPVINLNDSWMTDISEDGIGLDLKEPVPIGSPLVVDGAFWHEVGIDPPVGRVMYCHSRNNSRITRYHCGVAFMALEQQERKNLRRWLFRGQLSRMRPAV